jgi:predicted small lipoprotein YifL
MRATLIAAMLGGALLVSACGIKGPLYVPDVPTAHARNGASGGADHNKAPVHSTESK